MKKSRGGKWSTKYDSKVSQNQSDFLATSDEIKSSRVITYPRQKFPVKSPLRGKVIVPAWLSETRARMPVLRSSKKELKNFPKNCNFVVHTHLTKETAVLIHILLESGIRIVIYPDNQYSIDPKILSWLLEMERINENLRVLPRGEINEKSLKKQMKNLLKEQCQVVLDDGGKIITYAVEHKLIEFLRRIKVYVEQTRNGVNRIQDIAKKTPKNILFPIALVGTSHLKDICESRETGRTAVRDVLALNNYDMRGKVVVVVGYGKVGMGAAMSASTEKASVIVCEKDVYRADEALMDGFRVMSLKKAVRLSDFLFTATGSKNVITKQHYEVAKDGCVFVNAGSSGVMEMKFLAKQKSEETYCKHITKYILNKKKIYVIAKGRPVNLAVDGEIGKGNNPECLDVTFALMVKSIIALTKKRFPPGLYNIDDLKVGNSTVGRIVAKRFLNFYAKGG